jgi:hypothetical protein
VQIRRLIGLFFVAVFVGQATHALAQTPLPRRPAISSRVGLSTNASTVFSRDAGHTVGVGSRVLWVFGDSLDGSGAAPSCALAWGRKADPEKIREELNATGRPKQCISFTAAEQQFEATHPNWRIALWPAGGGFDNGRREAVFFYSSFEIGPNYQIDGTDIVWRGTGLATAVEGQGTATRAPGFVFAPGDPTGSVKFMVLGNEFGPTVYVNAQAGPSRRLLGRVDRADVADKTKYKWLRETFSGATWVDYPDIALATNWLAQSGIGGPASVAWNSFLQKYVYIRLEPFHAPPTMLFAVSPRPEGPWSSEIEVDVSRYGIGPGSYYFLLHPAVSDDQRTIMSWARPGSGPSDLVVDTATISFR